MFHRALASTGAILMLSAGGSISTTAQSIGGEDAVEIIGQKLTGEDLAEVHDLSLKMSNNPEIPYTAVLRGLLEVEDTMRPSESAEFEGARRSFEFGDDPQLKFNFSPAKLDADPRYIENLARIVKEAQDAPVFRARKADDIQGFNWDEMKMQQAEIEAMEQRTAAQAQEELIRRAETQIDPFSDAALVPEGRTETHTDFRIVEGLEIVEPDPYPDAVLVLGGGRLCSGTLVNKKAVITAAHCYCGGTNERVIVGRSLIQFEEVVDVEKNQSASYVSCDAADYTKKGDYAVLVLKQEVAVEPRRLATRDMVERSTFLRLVGFGRTQGDVVGRKFYVDAPIASYDCTGTIPGPRGVGRVSDESFYGCSPDFEIVAGGLGRDTCNGDSGGPAYILGGDGRLYLAGATSRSVSGEVKPCGEGGIYPRIDENLANWLQDRGIDVEVGRP